MAVPETSPSSSTGQKLNTIHFSIRIRLTHGDRMKSTKFAVPADPSAACILLGREIIYLVDPVVLGLYVDRVQKDPEKAAWLYEEAVKQGIQPVTAYNDWGIVLAEEKKLDEAILKFQNAIKEIPTSLLLLPTGVRRFPRKAIQMELRSSTRRQSN